jgi:prolipoprotein diacylglyceryltransferase
MVINLADTQALYGLFYQIAFASALLVLFVEGRRRNYPVSTWLLLVCFIIGCIILGSKVDISSPGALKSLIFEQELNSAGRKSAIGGAVFGLMGIWLGGRLLRFKLPIADVFAFILPIIMLFQRIGCLMASCCFGTPTNSDFGIQYEGIGFLRDHHFHLGLISEESLISHAVHPVPFYFILVALLTILILFFAKNRLKQSGSLLLLSLLSMGTGRFVVEFFRDPVTNSGFGKTFAGLQALQWIMIPLSICGVIWLIRREKKAPVEQQIAIEPVHVERNLLVIVGFSAAIYALRGMFTVEEMAALHLQIAVASLALIHHLRQRKGQVLYKFAPIGMLALAFIMSSFAYKNKDWATKLDSLPAKSSFTFNYSYVNLQATSYPCSEVTSSGCGGTYCSRRDKDRPFGPDYNAFTAGYEYADESKGKWRSVFGVKLQAEIFNNSDSRKDQLLGNAHIYLGREDKFGNGARVGLRLGQMHAFNSSVVGSKNNALPTFRFGFGVPFVRAGVVGFQVSVLDSEFTGGSTALAEFKLKSSILNRVSPRIGTTSFAYGYLEAAPSTYFMLQSEFFLSPNWVLSPSAGFSQNKYKQSNFNASFGIKYNIPRN